MNDMSLTLSIEREIRRMKRGKKKSNKLYNECWKLMQEIVFLRARYKSEISGIPKEFGVILQPHHCMGKSTNALCFDTRGLICITAKEHNSGCHSSNQSVQSTYFMKCVEVLKAREGDNIMDILEMQKNNLGADLRMIKLQLEQELKGVKNAIK